MCYSDYLHLSKDIINVLILIKALVSSRTLNATEYSLAVVTSNCVLFSNVVTLK
jgi:hypothetical protein